jgi:hypothetical protein
MSFLFTLQQPMVVYSALEVTDTRLSSTGAAFPANTVVKVKAPTTVVYNHLDKYALKLAEGNGYLLVEDINRDIRHLAYRWTAQLMECQQSGTVRERMRAGVQVAYRRCQLLKAIQQHLVRERPRFAPKDCVPVFDIRPPKSSMILVLGVQQVH